MNEEKDLCYKSTAIQILGISKAKFEDLGLEPVKEVSNPRYSSAYPAQLFDRKEIEELAKSPQIIALRSKARKPKDWPKIFKKRYGGQKAALVDAAEGMFNLNRYAKHDSCAAYNRREIYSLKNRFVRALYQGGYCKGAYVHINRLPRQTCRRCNGSGLWGSVAPCRKCRGTGIYKKSKELIYYVFQFVIDDHHFTWHQPEELVDFDVTLTSTDPLKMNPTEEKPLTMAYRKLSEAKALVKWCLEEIELDRGASR